jgi:alginate O-acetyltransferase complex protein AlgI
MSFTSLTFLLFLAAALMGYYLLPKQSQKLFLLAVNYIFYMWWKPSFGVLLLLGTVFSYFAALAIQKQVWHRKKLWLVLDVVYTLGLLLVFKYLDFLFRSIAWLAGREMSFSLNLILPVGISFFSFGIVGYVFDVYRGKLPAEKNFVEYAAFVSFFPSILAGPIGCARDFLPQIKKPHFYDSERVKRGLMRFVWGAAKKMIVADTLGIIVNKAYSSPEGYSGGLWLAVVIFYSFQIYFDFSAYSDMALGVADMLGFKLTENFRAPYLSRSVKSFWKKWHISLTSWFREYLYFPLGGSRGSRLRTYINILIVFAVSGLWHGAAFTFIIWGLLNGLYQVMGQITQPLRDRLYKRMGISERNIMRVLLQGLFTFGLITASWVFFRAESLPQAVFIIKRILLIFVRGVGDQGIESLISTSQLAVCGVWALLCIVEDCFIASGKRPWPGFVKTNYAFYCVMAILAASIFLFGVYGQGFNAQDFVYFKF